MKSKIIFIFLHLLLITATSSFFFQTTDWKGTVENENGVEVIKNPSEPQYGEITFELMDDLFIDDKDGEDFFFQWLVDIDVDSDGNIFVLDRQQCKVFIFDKEGSYIKAIGGKGQGPGEFISPKKIFLDNDNRIHVLEDRRLHKFDDKVEFAKTINLRYFLLTCSLSVNGHILALATEMNPKGLKQRIFFLSPEGEIAKTLAEHTIAIDRLENPNSSTGFGPTLHLSPSENDHAVFGNSAEYRLYLIDGSGKIVRIIDKDEPQKRESYFTGLFTHYEGLIFVDRWGIGSEKGEPSSLDVFNIRGHFIYKAYTNNIHIKIIKKDHIYTLGTDSDTGAQYIKRYKIKNWDLIRKGM